MQAVGQASFPELLQISCRTGRPLEQVRRKGQFRGHDVADRIAPIHLSIMLHAEAVQDAHADQGRALCNIILEVRQYYHMHIYPTQHTKGCVLACEWGNHTYETVQHY